MALDADVVIVGAGLAGLVAACELAEAKKKVVIVEQEPEQSLGGQSFWSLGGLFFVDSPEQRRMRIRDSHDLAWLDWLGAAGFDRDEDHWPKRWAEAYVAFAAGEKRSWLVERGLRFFPVVGWAERGGHNAIGHGNSVPRFHIAWGTGPGVLEPFAKRALEAAAQGLISFKFRHRVNEITRSGGAIDGVAGDVLEPSAIARGEKSSRASIGAVRGEGAGRDHRLGRHRRQSCPRPPELAKPSWRAAAAYDHRRARSCRWTHAGDFRSRRRGADQS